MKLLITSNSFGSANPGVFEELKEAGFEIQRNPYGRIMNEDELMELLSDKDAVILGTENLTDRVIDACRNLKVVSRYGVGCDHVDIESLKRHGIALEIARNANSEAVADHAVAMMLSLAHNLPAADADFRRGVWKKRKGVDLFCSKVGIIGLGAIGRGVARRVSGFQCEIYAFDQYYDESFMEEFHVRKADIPSILQSCDFISLHLPAVEAFRGLIGRETLRMMKDTAILVNTARAELVDKEAVLEALKERRLGGYGADVFWDEPSTDAELSECENTVLTPHMAAVTDGAVREMSRISAENVLKHFR